VVGQQVLGCGPVAVKVAAQFRKTNMLAAATVQQLVVVVASDIFVKNPPIRRFVLVSAKYPAALTSTLAEERLRTWAAPPVVVAPNCNVVTILKIGILPGEACVSAVSGIKVQEDGAAMTTMKAAILDILGLILVACQIVVFS
jgi:hypothetical protein